MSMNVKSQTGGVMFELTGRTAFPIAQFLVVQGEWLSKVLHEKGSYKESAISKWCDRLLDAVVASGGTGPVSVHLDDYNDIRRFVDAVGIALGRIPGDSEEIREDMREAEMKVQRIIGGERQ